MVNRIIMTRSKLVNVLFESNSNGLGRREWPGSIQSFRDQQRAEDSKC